MLFSIQALHSLPTTLVLLLHSRHLPQKKIKVGGKGKKMKSHLQHAHILRLMYQWTFQREREKSSQNHHQILKMKYDFFLKFFFY